MGSLFGVILILLTIVLPLLGKSKQGQGTVGKAPVKPVRPMPTFGGGPGERKPPQPRPSALSREEARRDAERLERENMSRQWEEERAAARERERMERQQAREAEAARKPAAAAAPITATAALTHKARGSGLPLAAKAPGSPEAPAPAAFSLDTAAEEMARAVVWSEILGPPRSKRPYGR
ncbi:MAG: hypothetical protein K0R57_4433 [Paenibacillaceae bacterium]|jgi:hypothetical protein|nr:hypothetical protein [Paenibacillaceae bacterium]